MFGPSERSRPFRYHWYETAPDPDAESAHALTEIAARIAATARERGLGQVERPLPVVS